MNLSFTIINSKRIEPTTEVGVCSHQERVTDLFGTHISKEEPVFFYRNVLEKDTNESSKIHEYVNSNGTTLLVQKQRVSEILSETTVTESEVCWDCSEDISNGRIVYSNPLSNSDTTKEFMCQSCVSSMCDSIESYYAQNKKEILVKLV